ncbi:heavy-metal-associated domain-containing protein [Pseudomonas stutzeri]|uniref:Copper-binding protein n=1 Tax=Stutzerimonas stutzeri TaxID=316 RepID=A0A2N8S6W3_STUST|nr:heavy-metal-associated domain-containing protein [Stutzerimonas stutzeri]MCQ4294667.1 heavy-metal-associated domain-containing protein [Stutzerimonas stutzeri]PNF82364.1 copper-binding protein [Stutzerimonas stutzeri]
MTNIQLKVSGMTCGACVRHVTAALQPLPGVERVEVDLATGLARIDGTADSAVLIATLDEAGYPAEIATGSPVPAPRKTGCGCGCN